MVSSGIFLLFAIMLRILMGHVAQKFVALTDWLQYFNWICIAMAAVVALFIIFAIIRGIIKLATTSKVHKEKLQEKSSQRAFKKQIKQRQKAMNKHQKARLKAEEE